MSAQLVYSVFGNLISVFDTSQLTAQWLSQVLIMCFVLYKNGLIWSILHALIAMMKHKDGSEISGNKNKWTGCPVTKVILTGFE